MNKRPAKGTIYKNNSSGGLGSSLGNMGDLGINPNYDPNFNPNQEGAYAFTKQGYDPNVNYTDPFLDQRSKFLGLIPMGQNTAKAANQQYLLTKGMMPLGTEAERQKQDVLTKSSLDRISQQADFENSQFGKSLRQLDSGGAIPGASNIYGSNDIDAGRNWKALTGSFGQQGALAGVPAAQAGAATSEYNKNLTQGRTPYAYPLGVNQAMNEIEQQNVQRETARPAEDARISLIKANALNNSYTQGGFHLGSSGLPDSFAFKPEHFQQTTTEHETMVGPDGKTIVLPTLRPVTKPYSVGMRLGNIPSGVTPEEDIQTRGNSPDLQPVTPQQPAQQPTQQQPYSLLSKPQQFQPPTVSGTPQMVNGKLEAKIKDTGNGEQKTPEQKAKEQADALKKLQELLAPYLRSY